MLANIEPKHVSKLEALRQSVAGSEHLEVGQRFGAVHKEARRPASGADIAANEQHETPAEAGRES